MFSPEYIKIWSFRKYWSAVIKRILFSRMCLVVAFQNEFWENADLQTSKENGFSPVSLIMNFQEMQISLTSQEHGFSQVYIHIWHYTWWNGFFPVCFNTSLFRYGLSENKDPLTSKEYVLFPVSIHMWLFKWELQENANPQTSKNHGCRSTTLTSKRFPLRMFSYLAFP